jgi:signal transduction histidine kinase
MRVQYINMKKLLQKFWQVAGRVPLWSKILGIVVVPVLLVISAWILAARQEVLNFLKNQDRMAVPSNLYSALTVQALVSLLLIGLVGLAFAYGMSLILAHPLRQLLEVIKKIEQGDLSARVNVWAEDEIGQVQRSFNTMAGKLEASQKSLLRRNLELSLMNAITSDFSLGKNAERLMETALDEILKVVEADVASVYLLEADGASFQQIAMHGSLSSLPAQTLKRRPAGESLMNRVIHSGQALAVEHVAEAPELPHEIAEALREDHMMHWASAPVKESGAPIGAFNLLRRADQPFTSAELSLMEMVGNVIGLSLTNARLAEDVQQKEADLRRALRRSVEYQEEERKRLARELHDEAGQALTSILIRLKALQTEVHDPDTLDRLDGLRYLTAQTIEDLRRISMDLRPAALDNLGILPALRWYTEEYVKRTGLAAEFSAPEEFERLPAEVELVLYRSAQEGLTNALRHSQAQKVEVRLERRPRVVRLQIRDDGKGFTPKDSHRGLGLVGIRERVELLNGSFGIKTTPGLGTCLWVEIPVNEKG